jgi:hypothetical protein
MASILAAQGASVAIVHLHRNTHHRWQDSVIPQLSVNTRLRFGQVLAHYAVNRHVSQKNRPGVEDSVSRFRMQ